MTLKSLNLKLLNKRTHLTKNKYSLLQWGVNSVFGTHCIFWDSFYISHPSTKLHLRAFGMQTAIRLLRFLLQLGLCRGSIKATRPTLSQCTHCGETTKVVHCSSASEASRSSSINFRRENSNSSKRWWETFLCDFPTLCSTGQGYAFSFVSKEVKMVVC